MSNISRESFAYEEDWLAWQAAQARLLRPRNGIAKPPKPDPNSPTMRLWKRMKVRERRRRLRQSDPERIREQERRYYARNLEKYRAYSREWKAAWRKAHPDESLWQQAIWRDAHRDEIRARQKAPDYRARRLQYKHSHPEVMRRDCERSLAWQKRLSPERKEQRRAHIRERERQRALARTPEDVERLRAYQRAGKQRRWEQMTDSEREAYVARQRELRQRRVAAGVAARASETRAKQDERDRLVLSLRDEGMKLREIGELLGISEGGAFMAIKRAEKRQQRQQRGEGAA